jgi:hypothetical protein
VAVIVVEPSAFTVTNPELFTSAMFEFALVHVTEFVGTTFPAESFRTAESWVEDPTSMETDQGVISTNRAAAPPPFPSGEAGLPSPQAAKARIASDKRMRGARAANDMRGGTGVRSVFARSPLRSEPPQDPTVYNRRQVFTDKQHAMLACRDQLDVTISD